MRHEHLFIGGPSDGERFTVLYGDAAFVFGENGQRHTYRRIRLADTLGVPHDVFIHDGEPINVVEMLIKNYRKEEK